MVHPDQSECRNRLLMLMSEADFALVAPHLELMAAPKGIWMALPNEPFEHVFFPETAIGSIIAISPDGVKVEAGLVGRCGFSPAAAILGTDRTPHEFVIQVPGECYRMPRAALVRMTEESASLRHLLLRFVQVLSVQVAYTALSNATHSIDERLARWILMCHDRSDSDDLALTHEFIAVMLAVRRPSVTTSLHVLEGNRFIRNDRGHIVMRDRLGLEHFAADGYGVPEAEYRRLIGSLTASVAPARQVTSRG